MTKKPYHHGDLRNALLEAAEAVLRRDGIAGIGMRAIAREAGVSHTAAKPHFGDLDGLLSELAAVGYRQLASALRAAAAVGRTPRGRRVAIARAYVGFAQANVAMFGLMFRTEIVDMRHPTLRQAANGALHALAGAMTDSLATTPAADDATPPRLSRSAAIAITTAWSKVHGLATLAVDQRLLGILRTTNAFTRLDDLVDATLDSMTL
jgi:AcrR family transcriptional regulator